MSDVLALAGDTMLGRGVAERLQQDPPESFFGPRLRSLMTGADAAMVNLECCISDRGRRWPTPGKQFFFRAPPVATQALRSIGVGLVTLANNHALDFGYDALADTLDHLHHAGIATVGAGRDLTAAHLPSPLDVGGTRIGVVALTDHPPDFAAGPHTPGVAFADLDSGVPPWVHDAVEEAGEHGPVLISPHWGPNMVREPVRHVRRAAEHLLESGPALVAGHSAHVFHGVSGRVLFDLGDFIDDYAVHPRLRNDLGLLWLLHVSGGSFRHAEVVPLRLRYAFTEVADGPDAAWVGRRFTAACQAMGTSVHEGPAGHLVVDLS